MAFSRVQFLCRVSQVQQSGCIRKLLWHISSLERRGIPCGPTAHHMSVQAKGLSGLGMHIGWHHRLSRVGKLGHSQLRVQGDDPLGHASLHFRAEGENLPFPRRRTNRSLRPVSLEIHPHRWRRGVESPLLQVIMFYSVHFGASFWVHDLIYSMLNVAGSDALSGSPNQSGMVSLSKFMCRG